MGAQKCPVPSSKNESHVEMECSMLLSKTTSPWKKQFSCDSICRFSNLAKNKSEYEERSKSMKKLGGVIGFVLFFMIMEIIGGIKANSLAILTDAAHLLTDIAGFTISLLSIWASGWDPTPQKSFGFLRVEVLGALLSVQLIWLVTGILIYEAFDRILHENNSVNGRLMFVTATVGFIINLIMVVWIGHDHTHHGHVHTHHGHDHDQDHVKVMNFCSNSKIDVSDKDEEVGEKSRFIHQGNHNHILQVCSERKKNHGRTETCHRNLNLEGAYLHILGDLMQSLGVMIGGAIIWVNPDWLVVDLICTLGFSVFVLATTSNLLRSVTNILMESTPDEIDAAEIESDLRKIDGVSDVHDLHIWALTAGKTLLACHVVSEPGQSSNEILCKIRTYCEDTHNIDHVTIQVEQGDYDFK